MSELGPTPSWLQGSARLTAAFELASQAHSGQAAKDGSSPYIRHPLAVAERLHACGMDEPTVAAAILHDVLEDSDLALDEIVRSLGLEVGELVSALTDDESIEDWADRKREHRKRVAAAGPRAATIYAADKLMNVRELRTLYDRMGEAAGGRLEVSIDERVAMWHEDLAMLDEIDPRGQIVAELRDELDAFEAQRPSAERAAAP